MAPTTVKGCEVSHSVSQLQAKFSPSLDSPTAGPSLFRRASPASPAAPGTETSSNASKQPDVTEPAETTFWDHQIAKGNLRMCSVKYPTYVNVMLYGESGLGKTTTILNLIGNWGIKRAGSAFSKAVPSTKCPSSGGVGDSGKTSLDEFKRNPDNLRIELEPIMDDTSNLEMHFSFQDMPGWGDDINLVNSLRTVVGFLLQQRQKDYIHNKAGLTEHCAAPGTMIKHGITVCLYLVPPHRMKPIDWIMMAAISKLVAVIPVIAKADTFTAQEMEDYRQDLLKVIRHASYSPAADDASSSSSTSQPSTPAAAASTTAGEGGTALLETTLGEEIRSRSTRGDKTDSISSSVNVPRSTASAPAGPARLGGRVFAMPLAKSLLGQGDIRESMRVSRGAGKAVNEDNSDSIDLARSLCLETYAFRTSDLELVNASPDQIPPLAIVASKDLMTAEDAKQAAPADHAHPGLPFRRYRWGTAFPLNRDHSDMIILKQLLFGHRNFAVHDLLQDSWRRAHIFAKEYEVLLAKQQCAGVSARGPLQEVSLQPMEDALLCSACGGENELVDQLRSEEAKQVMTSLSKVEQELAHRKENEAVLMKQIEQLKIDECSMRLKMGKQQAMIERLSAELEKSKRRWRLKG